MALQLNGRLKTRLRQTSPRTTMLTVVIGLGAAIAAFASTYAQLDQTPSAGRLVMLAVSTVLSGAIASATTLFGGNYFDTRRPPVTIAYVTADQGWAVWIRQELTNLGFEPLLYTKPLEDAPGQVVALLSRTAVARGGGVERWFASVTARHSPRPVIARLDDVVVPEEYAPLVDVALPELNAEAAADALLQALQRRGTKRPRPLHQQSRSVPFPGRGPAVTNVPPRNPDFTGRADLLKRLDDELIGGPGAPGQVTATVLHGLGGVGKTQTALEYVYRHAGHYEIVWWVAAERPSAIITSLRQLARRLGMPAGADRDELLGALWSALYQRERWLIVFDSAADAETLWPFWPAAGDGHVLVTSRSRHWHGLIHGGVAVGVPSHEDAARYLCRRSADQDTEAARELARELDNLPLALAQAASYVYEKKTRLSDYLRLLKDTRHKVSLLKLNPPPDYGRTVLHTWQLSIDEAEQQAPGARLLLTVLCFLAGEDIPRALPPRGADGLPAELAERISDPVAYDDMVGALAKYSLINAHTEWLSIHQLMQFTVRERLDPAEHKAWAAHAVRLTARAFPYDPADPATWQDCGKLVPHAIAVCDMAEDLGVAAADVGDLLRRAAEYLDLQGDADTPERLLERALKLQRPEPGADRIPVALTLRALALARLHQMRVDTAREAFEEAIAIEEAAADGHDELIAQTLADFAEMLREIPDLAAAEAAALRALTIAREIYGPDDVRTAPYYQRLGLARWRAGELEQARRHHARALGIHEGTGGPPDAGVAESSKNLGIVCRDLCRFEQAESHLARAVRIAERAYGERHPMTLDSVMHLADVRRLLGDPQTAYEMLEIVRAETAKRLSPRHTDLAGVHTKMGAALRDLGRLDEARDALTAAAEAYERARGDRHPYLAETLVQLGPARRLLNDPIGARRDLRQAEKILTGAYDPGHPALAEVYEYLVPLLRETGTDEDATEADRLADRAISVRERASTP